MIRVDPASTEFERLPRQTRAIILLLHFNWSQQALAEEFGVTRTTIRTWTVPGERERRRAAKSAYFKTERGRARRRQYVRNHRARLKDISSRQQRGEGE